MVKTVPIDLLINLILGLVFALVAGPAVERKSIGDLVQYPVIFACLVFGPVGFYLFVTQPDWSLMYLVPFGDQLPSFWGLLVATAYASFHLGGFLLGVGLIKMGKSGVCIGICAFAGLALLGICLGLYSELMSVGTLEEFEAGQGTILYESGVFLFLSIVTPVIVGSTGWILWRFHGFREEAEHA